MFTYLVVILMTIVIYNIFIEDSIKDFFKNRKLKQTNVTAAEKIAKVKAVSDDVKDIENFISKNAENLNDNIINILVDRIEAIKAEKIIDEDKNSLRQRISDISLKGELLSEIQPVENYIPSLSKQPRSSRK